MKRILTIVLLAIMTLNIVACDKSLNESKKRSAESAVSGTLASSDSVKTTPADTQAPKEIPEFKYEKFYVMIGTMGDNNEYARLRYFDGDEVDMVVWKHSPSEFKYGDVFIPGEGVSPENVVVNETDPAYPRSWFELQKDADLKLIGNCRDFFESKKLKVTGNDYDGVRHFSIHLMDDKGTEYYYGFFDLGPFGVEISSAEIGAVYDCAVRNGKIIIPLAGPVK